MGLGKEKERDLEMEGCVCMCAWCSTSKKMSAKTVNHHHVTHHRQFAMQLINELAEPSRECQ